MPPHLDDTACLALSERALARALRETRESWKAVLLQAVGLALVLLIARANSGSVRWGDWSPAVIPIAGLALAVVLTILYRWYRAPLSQRNELRQLLILMGETAKFVLESKISVREEGGTIHAVIQTRDAQGRELTRCYIRVLRLVGSDGTDLLQGRQAYLAWRKAVGESDRATFHGTEVLDLAAGALLGPRPFTLNTVDADQRVALADGVEYSVEVEIGATACSPITRVFTLRSSLVPMFDEQPELRVVEFSVVGTNG